MGKKTYVQKIQDALIGLEVNETVDRKALIKGLYGSEDYFISRSFDVAFVAAKKLLAPKKFKSLAGKMIKRIS